MSLDMNNFDLFSKKKPAPIAKPVEKKVEAIESKPVIVKKEQVQEKVIEAKIDHVELPIIEDSIIETNQRASRAIEVKTEKSLEAINESVDSTIPKYERFLPVTARIPDVQLDELKRIESTIMRSRTKHSKANRERITVNSIMRCMIESFLDRAGDLDLNEIDNEVQLKDRVEKVFKQRYSKRV